MRLVFKGSPVIQLHGPRLYQSGSQDTSIQPRPSPSQLTPGTTQQTGGQGKGKEETLPKQPKDNTKSRRHQSKPWTHSDPTQVASAKRAPILFLVTQEPLSQGRISGRSPSSPTAVYCHQRGGGGRVCLGDDTGKIDEALVLLSRTQLSACQMNAHSERQT